LLAAARHISRTINFFYNYGKNKPDLHHKFIPLFPQYTVNKGLANSCPQPGCHLPNSPWPGIMSQSQSLEGLVQKIQESRIFFYSVDKSLFERQIKAVVSAGYLTTFTSKGGGGMVGRGEEVISVFDNDFADARKRNLANQLA